MILGEPKLIKDFIGQDNIKINLKSLVEWAKRNNTVLDHTILLGPPGHGKTTLSEIIAHETESKLIKSFGGGIKESNIQSLLDIFFYSKDKLVVFIDEIHAVKPKFLEYLYLPMERFEYNGKALNKFCLIGATTDFGLLPKPFRDRFRNKLEFNNYSHQDIVTILHNRGCNDLIAEYISKRSRYTPRLAIDLFRRILVEWDNESEIHPVSLDRKMCDRVFTILNIDRFGLNEKDREIINYLYSVNAYETCARPIPCGLDALSTALNMSKSDYISLYEPYLLQQNLIIRTPRGRVASKIALFSILRIDEKFNEEPEERQDIIMEILKKRKVYDPLGEE